jgi:hypothetical protein
MTDLIPRNRAINPFAVNISAGDLLRHVFYEDIVKGTFSFGRL